MNNPENNQTEAEIEEFSDEFKCCVCLDLIYKPVVLACGHISCFWCVFEAMDTRQESHCPVCRHSYNHFPSICRLLHFVLLKLYPKAYKRRERQVIEDEKNLRTFSPQFEDDLSESHSSKEFNLNNSSLKSSNRSLNKLQVQSNYVGEDELSLVKDSLETIQSDKDHVTTIATSLNDEATRNMVIQENGILGNNHVDGACKQLLISDLLCVICKQLLYRPLVLNCGHVFCEACIINSCNNLCRCLVCQSMHPKGFPKVCLVLEHLLEEHFSKEYAERSAAVQKLRNFLDESSSTCSTQVPQSGVQYSSLPTNDYFCGQERKAHFGFGCDCCGMFPIIGERFRCKDCVEEVGFDLCEECYISSSKLPGRFNQQHTPEHKFEVVVQPMLFLTANDLEEYSPENLEDPIEVSGTLDPSHDAHLNPEAGVAASISSNDTAEHQEGTEPTS